MELIDKCELIDSLEVITNKMIAFAERGCWEEMAALQEERSGMYDQLKQAFDSGNFEFKAIELVKLKEKNDTLLSYTKGARENSRDALQKLQGRKKASAAYQAK